MPVLGPVALVLAEAVDKVAEEQHARDLARVVAEKEAANGGGGPQHKGFDTTVGAIDADGSAEVSL